MNILPCPCCGKVPEVDSEDFIYSVGRPKYNLDSNQLEYVYSINCAEIWGGCSLHILGSSKEECIRKWNTRYH